MAHLARIRLHPIKSLDGIEVLSAGIRPDGSLELDREYAFVGEDGRPLETTQVPALHRIRADYDLDGRIARLRHGIDGQPQEFHLDRDGESLADWASEVLGRRVAFRRASEGNFTKGSTASGPTLVSTASLVAVACWFPGLSVPDLRRRLRANLEVVGVPAFFEDGMYGAEPDDPVRFRLGEIELLGAGPCRRCASFARDPDSGEADESFAAVLAQNRERARPRWAHPGRFETYYCLSINTAPGRIAQGARLSFGDTLIVPGR